MPIYEETYRSWEGQLLAKPKVWWVIARQGVRLLWKRSTILWLAVATFPFVARAIQIYIVTQAGENNALIRSAKGIQIDSAFFANFLTDQMFFLFIMAVIVGSGLIADDRKWKALPLYFSKPVGFWDYGAGKWMVLGFYMALVTMVPDLLLFLIRVLLSHDSVFVKKYFYIPISIVGSFACSLVVFGSLILALSALCRTRRAAAVLFFAVLLFLDGIREMLARVPDVGVLSIAADVRQVIAMLFGIKAPYGFPTWAAAAVLAGLVSLSVVAVRWKVKPTEVVK